MPESPEAHEERFVVFSVDGRKGDRATGQFLGTAHSLCEAFATAGAAIEDDEKPEEGRHVCLIIRDQYSYRTWTITRGF